MAEVYVELRGVVTGKKPMTVRPIHGDDDYVLALDLDVQEGLGMPGDDTVVEILLTAADINNILLAYANRKDADNER